MQARRVGWFVNLGTVALGVYVVVGTIGSAIGYAVHSLPSVDDWDPGPQAASQHQPRRASDLDGIAERNLFGARREVLALDDRAVVQEDVPCSLRGRLRATIVAPDVPDWSVAVIMDPTANEPRVYFPNTPISSEAHLVAVNYRSVLIRRRGRIERCGLDDEPAATLPQAVAAASVVERQSVDACLTNLEACARQAHAVPTDGGLQVVRIKPGSLFERLGLRNGDIVMRVNGHAITDLGRGLDTFAALREASHIVVELKRGSSDVTMSYDIR